MTEANFNTKTLLELFEPMVEDCINPVPGIPLTWWAKTNAFAGGLRPHELTVLCAPTGAGKTELLASLAAQVALQDIPIFAAPVETGSLDFAKRLIGQLTHTDINSGDPVPIEAMERLTAQVLPFVKRSGQKVFISTYDNRVDVGEMVNLLEWHASTNGVKVAILDNLNFFLNVTRAQNALIEMDIAVHEFVMAVKRIPIHVILVMHPRKTDGGRVESEFDIKGSSTAVQEAANIMLFNRPKTEDVESGKRHWFDREMVFKKIRKRGRHVNKPVWFTFEGNQYQELPDEAQ